MTKHITLDLTEHVGLKTSSIVSAELGMKLADEFDTFSNLSQKVKLQVFVPHHVLNLSVTFLESLFGTALRIMSLEDFNKLVTFDCDETTTHKGIESNLRIVWDRINAKPMEDFDSESINF